MSRTTFFEVEILDSKTKEQLCFLDKVEPHSSVAEIKSLFHKSYPKWYPARQSLRLDPKGKALRDDDILQNLPVGTSASIYFKDLGPQLGWTMVFLVECLGPLLIYLLFYLRVPYIYSKKYTFTSSTHPVVSLACACHSFHYIKRLIETIFVHRFSHGTMPLRSIVRNTKEDILKKVAAPIHFCKDIKPMQHCWVTNFLQNIFFWYLQKKNCAYYWGFAAWLAYYINHPLYTPPSFGERQVYYALIIFLLCEAGNFSIHWTLNSLKCEGSKCRRYPQPSKNPFTWLFFFVSCPNYTYEVGAWVGLSIMTQCVPVALFTLVGFAQMTIWAKGKHKTYIKEFKDYPNLRMPILPLIL